MGFIATVVVVLAVLKISGVVAISWWLLAGLVALDIAFSMFAVLYIYPRLPKFLKWLEDKHDELRTKEANSWDSSEFWH